MSQDKRQLVPINVPLIGANNGCETLHINPDKVISIVEPSALSGNPVVLLCETGIRLSMPVDVFRKNRDKFSKLVALS